MINLFDILGISRTSPDREELEKGTLFRELEKCFSDLTEQEIKFIAGFSGLLGRVALADMILEEEELEKIRQILNRETSISAARVDRIVNLLKMNADEYFGSENVYYTRLINASSDKKQKMDVLNALFAVAAANESVSAEEEAEMKLIADGLRLTHPEYIDVRLKYRDKLDIFKK